MKKTASRRPAKARNEIVVAPLRQLTALTQPGEFDEVLALIEVARSRAYQAVNSELVGLYWALGEYISHKLASAAWGEGVVDELAAALAREYPGRRGYTRTNLLRMRQFYETYRDDKKVVAPLRQLPWTHHMRIMGQVKEAQERHFYMLAAISGKWSSRELERQIRTDAARRSEVPRKRVSAALTQIHPAAA